jgi:hypothetical protein
MHILFWIKFFRKLCRLEDNVERFARAGQATDDNMAYAHCIPDKQGYEHTQNI